MITVLDMQSITVLQLQYMGGDIGTVWMYDVDLKLISEIKSSAVNSEEKAVALLAHKTNITIFNA